MRRKESKQEKLNNNLRAAVRLGRLSKVEKLLDLGADVNGADRDGFTPLYLAAARGRPQITQLLLKHGADIHCKTCWGTTPLDTARYNYHYQVEDILLQEQERLNQLTKQQAQSAYQAIFSPSAPPPSQPGQRMPDGTIYVGLSPDTQRPLYTLPQDEARLLEWGEALVWAATAENSGHRDWRLPSRGELKLLFNQRAAVGNNFVHDSWYWSSNTWMNTCILSWGRNFSAGKEKPHRWENKAAVRLVRG